MHVVKGRLFSQEGAMNKHIRLAAGLILAIGVFGCEKEETPATSVNSAQPAAAEPTTPAVPSADSVKDKTTDMTAAAKDKTTEVAAATKDKAAEVNNSAAAASSSAVADAQSKLDEVMQYIKENKLDLAEKSLDGLDKIKAQLPESIQSKLAEARTMLNTAKAAGGVKLPGQ